MGLQATGSPATEHQEHDQLGHCALTPTAAVTAPTGGTPRDQAAERWMFDGKINPGQLQIIREITTTGADRSPISTRAVPGRARRYAFSATADGQVIVTHAVEDSLDGTDRLRNIERVEFLDGNPLNVIVGTPGNDMPLQRHGTGRPDPRACCAATCSNGLAGNDILVGGAGTRRRRHLRYADNFNTRALANLPPPADQLEIRTGRNR